VPVRVNIPSQLLAKKQFNCCEEMRSRLKSIPPAKSNQS